jgi:hypothetical protein
VEVVGELPIRTMLVPVNGFPWSERLVTKTTVAISKVRIVVIEHQMEKLLDRIQLSSKHKYPVKIVLLPEENFAIILV